MHDVIQKIMSTEAEARRMVQTAKTEAEQILAEARKRAQELTAAARKDVQIKCQGILLALTQEAEKDKQTSLALAAAGIEKQVSISETTKQRAVAAVVRCVCG